MPVGLAIADRHLAAEFNEPEYDIFDHFTYVICGDGCMQEGVASEACSSPAPRMGSKKGAAVALAPGGDSSTPRRNPVTSVSKLILEASFRGKCFSPLLKVASSPISSFSY